MRIQPGSGLATGAVGAPGASKAVDAMTRSFTQAVKEVNKMQLESAKSGQEMAMGNGPALHRVLVQAEEASLALQLTVALRNKALDAYQEVMRMQV